MRRATALAHLEAAGRPVYCQILAVCSSATLCKASLHLMPQTKVCLLSLGLCSAQITGLAWLEAGGRLVSCAKDGYVKVWELATQHCSQTIVGHRCAEQPTLSAFTSQRPKWPSRARPLESP